MEPILIVGLGNPGASYEGTRHNVGFMVVDALARRWNCPLASGKWRALSARLQWQGRPITLLQPQTFMNLSGESVREPLRFFKMSPEHLLVIHDDLDMALGRLKLVRGGGAGGHKGIISIVRELADGDFYRLKIGIGRPGKNGVPAAMPVERFVLAPFLSEERDLLDERLAGIIAGIEDWARGLPDKAMNRLNAVK
ncbi:MAG: aminoacyl-tRNA hydrolase [Desulfobulbaceae bacterium]|jgi:PTH1 family peptidyl-tRNA hydrolase|nr:aminoacyl-tRNA hydrolase [Desulfobulbaceae bacterium]